MNYTSGFIDELKKKQSLLEEMETEVKNKRKSLKEYFENSKCKGKVDDLSEVIKTNINESQDEINNALGYVGDKRKSPPDTFTMGELNNAAAVIMSEEYAININDQINDYNSYHNPEVQQLTQYQFDCLAQFYWQCGAGSTEYYSSFYDEVAKAQRDIDNGDLESAYNEMENAFSNYGVVPESRCKEASELFVYGDYNI